MAPCVLDVKRQLDVKFRSGVRLLGGQDDPVIDFRMYKDHVHSLFERIFRDIVVGKVIRETVDFPTHSGIAPDFW